MCDRADIRRAEGLKNRRMIVSKDFYTPLLPYPTASRDVALKSKQEQRQFNRKALTSSSAHVCAIGEVARSDGGVERLFRMSPLIFFLYSSQIQSFRFSVSVLTPSPCGYSPYIVAPHPAMLRDTAGREVAI